MTSPDDPELTERCRIVESSRPTRLPWRHEGRFVFGTGRKFQIGELPSGGMFHTGVDRANSELIVRAVNAYDSDQRIIEALLAACREALEELDNVYDVDEPEPGYRKESPFSGAGMLMEKLRAAIQLAESRKK